MISLNIGHPWKRKSAEWEDPHLQKHKKNYLDEGKAPPRGQHQPKMTKLLDLGEKKRKRHLPIWRCVLENSNTYMVMYSRRFHHMYRVN